jgi:hypothetical protein
MHRKLLLVDSNIRFLAEMSLAKPDVISLDMMMMMMMMPEITGTTRRRRQSLS